MEPDKFDRIARSLGDTVSRRGAVRAAFGGLLAGIAGVAGLADAEAKKAKQNKKKGQPKKGKGKKQQGVKTRSSGQGGGPPSCVGEGKECGNPGNNKQCCNDLQCIRRTGGWGSGKCGTCDAGETYCRERGEDVGRCCGSNEKCNTNSGTCSCKYESCNGKCCAEGEECKWGQCRSVCSKKTCADYPGQCGRDLSDGCGGKIDCGCGGGKDCCGGSCVDQKSDPNNCGQCGQTCGANEKCQNGSCVCKYESCGQTCCADGETCKNDTCKPNTCANTCDGCCSGETCKGGNSSDYCGTGGNACASCGANEKCDGGSCVCKFESCDGTCCADGETCKNGKCVENTCANTCDGCCVDGTCKPGNSGDYCGSGGGICKSCAPNEQCNGVKCVCKYEACDGTCCADGEYCKNGVCVESICKNTCGGCCDGESCKDGGDDRACGANGGTCQDCKALGKNGACVEGACVCKPSEVTCPSNYCGYVDDGCNNLVKCECTGGLVCGANDTCVDACKQTGGTCSNSGECCSGLTCKDGVCGTGGGQVTCAKRGGDCATMDCCNEGDTCAPGKNGRHVCVVAGATKPKCHHVGGRPGPGEKCCPRLHLERGRCVINRWDHCDPADGPRAFCERGTFCTGGRLAPHNTQVCVPNSKKKTRKKQRRRQKRQNMKEKTGQNRPNRPSIKDRLKLKRR